MKSNTVLTILLVIALFFVLFFMRKADNNANQAQNYKGLYEYQNQTMDSLKNKDSLTVMEQRAAQVTSQETIKALSAAVFDLKKSDERLVKKVDAFVTTDQSVKIKDKVIPYDSSKYTGKINIPVYNDSLVNRYAVVIPPMQFIDTSNKYYKIAGTVKLTGVSIDSITLANTKSWRIAEIKEKGFFKRLFGKPHTKVQTIDSNPYFATTKMNSIVLTPKQNTFNKWIKPVIFAVAGFFIKSKL